MRSRSFAMFTNVMNATIFTANCFQQQSELEEMDINKEN